MQTPPETFPVSRSMTGASVSELSFQMVSEVLGNLQINKSLVKAIKFNHLKTY